jgi:hypothetical protein
VGTGPLYQQEKIMRLYIANTTHQRQEVYYRLDFVPEGSSALRANNVKKIIIEPGRQVTVGGDLLPEQAQTIMDQLAIYGGIGVEEVSRIPNNKKVSYLMSFGKEIPMKLIRMMDEHNKWIMTGEGDERRRMAAIAAHPVIDSQIDNLKRLDIEMVEAPPEAGDPDPVGKPLDFGAHIDPTAKETKPRPPKRRSSLATRRG